MPTTRLVYLEPDPCLRGLMLRLMEQCPGLEVVSTAGTADEALALDLSHIDAAVVEQDLGLWSITGFDVALEFRRRKRVGIVLLTNHPVPEVSTLLGPEQHQGWSVVDKAVDVDPQFLAHVIESTARGLHIVDPRSQQRQLDHEARVIDRLTERQRRIMNLASSGRDGTAIAQELALAPVTVRQELSRIYAILIPDAAPGYDLRTAAVVRYLRELHLINAPSRRLQPISSAR